ncbi:MAG: hypothetical protein WDN09_00575 [bacterium]
MVGKDERLVLWRHGHGLQAFGALPDEVRADNCRADEQDAKNDEQAVAGRPAGRILLGGLIGLLLLDHLLHDAALIALDGFRDVADIRLHRRAFSRHGLRDIVDIRLHAVIFYCARVARRRALILGFHLP